MKKRQVVVQKSSSNRTSSSVRVRYGECQKNHAANIGGYAVDGCREFMAGGEEGTAAAVSCAACGCHRSFHRREVNEVMSEGSATSVGFTLGFIKGLCVGPLFPKSDWKQGVKVHTSKFNSWIHCPRFAFLKA
ncbi:hypothetical protein L1987_66693 [Smallanthus sonchifolius]|uniref:Uncharacterized protein n=1 Tax=Smallanthus sonchifolius TaxID=185202 RepID=A0ACB9BXU5_9ASTR|nr:hypothetical protein L1987_66693 [Smallanthus sonchifolius]